MRIGSLFSGIGGLELGLEWAGLGHTVWQVEQSEFCRRVLARHWPDVRRYQDVHEVGAHNLEPVDLICGGFPCQDISSAGKGAGLAGERSGLWFQFARVIGELRPRWVVVENVASGARRWVDQVTAGLGQLGFQTLPLPLSAADVGAPHLRRRVFLVAHAIGEPLRVEQGRCRGPGGQGALEPGHDGGAGALAGWSGGSPVFPVRGVDDGSPHRMDELRALGNAVVPQCAEVVGWVIKELMT
jgi:DNA (cytosine-5)-methyltransferase 1